MTVMTSLRLKHATSIFQAVILLAVGLVVIGALWTQEVRTAEASRQEDLTTSLDWYRTLICGSEVSRSEFWAMAPQTPAANAPLVGDPERIKALLPAGSTYDVLVKGGFVAQRKDNTCGGRPRTHVAYAFEMSYQRVIESNDGHRIVERRSFGTVRMAKILSTADDMSLQFGPPDGLVLEDIQFPGPGAGIVAAPVRPVAEAMLGSGVETVMNCNASLALLEEDPLSGKSVRLTYVDGIGIESVEALGWSFTGSQLFFLFCQPVLSSDLLPGQNCTELDPSRLSPFSDPTKLPHSGSAVLLEAFAASDGNVCGCRVLRIPFEVYGEDGSASPTSDQIRSAATPIGALQYDPDWMFVTQATLNWRFMDLEVSPDRLLFESRFNDFQSEPTFTVHYHCTKS